MTVLLALDIGTSKICALALHAGTGEVLAAESRANDAEVPNLPGERHEQAPQRILEICMALLSSLSASGRFDPAAAGGIGISGQMHGVLLADRDGNPLTNLVTWRDRRALGGDFLATLSERLGDSFPRRAGCRLSAGYGGATLAWLAQEGTIPRGAKAVSIADYVAGALTGVFASEETHAASWGLLDAGARAWNRDAIQTLGIPEDCLPELRGSARPLATLSPARAKALALPRSARVASPVGDNQASVIGAAGLAGKACIVNLGTGGQVSVPAAEYGYDAALETRPMPFGGHIRVGASLCGGWAYAYLHSFFSAAAREISGAELDDAALYACMNRLAAAVGPDAGGLRADTRFLGSRTDPAVRGALANIDAENFTPANLCRAVAGGMVEELAALARTAGLEGMDAVIASGNGVRRNPTVREEIARRFNLPVRLGEAREEAALGAACAAGLGLGILRKEEIARLLEDAK